MQTLIANTFAGANLVIVGMTGGAATDETLGNGDFTALVPAPLEDLPAQAFLPEGTVVIYTAALLAALPSSLPTSLQQSDLAAADGEVPANIEGVPTPTVGVLPEGLPVEAGPALALVSAAMTDVADASRPVGLKDVQGPVAALPVAAPSLGVEPASAVPAGLSPTTDAAGPASASPVPCAEITNISTKGQEDAAAEGGSRTDVSQSPTSLAGAVAETPAPGAVPVLLANVSTGGVRLWQGVFVQDSGTQGGGEDPVAPVVLSATSVTPAPAAPLFDRADAKALSGPVPQSDPLGEGMPDTAVGLATAGGSTPSETAKLSLSTATVQLAGQLVQTLSHRGDGTTELALSPDELGHVRITLQPDAQNPDRLVVMLTFERPETLDLFRRHADQLAEALRDAGYTRADISFGNAGTGGNNGSRPDSSDVAAAERLADGAPALAAEHAALRLATSGSLDLRL